MKKSNVSIRHLLITVFSLVFVTIAVQAESIDELQKKQPVTVSFFMVVDPDSKQLVSQYAQLGSKPVSLADINAELYQGKTLVIKGVSIENMSLPFPNPESYSVLGFGQCNLKNLAISGFGNGSFATYGLQNHSINFNPGLVATLPNEQYGLCASSYVQSNDKARIFVHGVLLEKF